MTKILWDGKTDREIVNKERERERDDTNERAFRVTLIGCSNPSSLFALAFDERYPRIKSREKNTQIKQG